MERILTTDEIGVFVPIKDTGQHDDKMDPPYKDKLDGDPFYYIAVYQLVLPIFEIAKE